MVSVRYRLLNGPSVPVSSLSPSLLLLNLNTGMDSGGSLVVSLLLNKVSRLLGWVDRAHPCSCLPRGLWVPVGLFSLSFLLLQNALSLF